MRGGEQARPLTPDRFGGVLKVPTPAGWVFFLVDARPTNTNPAPAIPAATRSSPVRHASFTTSMTVRPFASFTMSDAVQVVPFRAAYNSNVFAPATVTSAEKPAVCETNTPF